MKTIKFSQQMNIKKMEELLKQNNLTAIMWDCTGCENEDYAIEVMASGEEQDFEKFNKLIQ